MNGASKRSFVTAFAIFFVLGLAGLLARHAHTAKADACQLSSDEFHADLQNGQIVMGTIIPASGTASVTITNNTDCDAPVSLSAYEMFLAPNTPQWLSTQQIVGITSSSLTPSSTITLNVPILSCMTQIDAWYGTAPNSLLDTNPYGYPNVPYVLMATFAGSPLCPSASSSPPIETTSTPPTSGGGGDGGGGTGGGGGNGGGGGGGSVATAEIAVTKTVDNQNPNPGDTIHYTVTVEALGPAASVNVVEMDTLPAGITLVSAIPSAGIYASSTGTWLLGNITTGARPTLIITAIVNSSDTPGEVITNTATVGESNAVNDPLSANNFSTAAFTVGGASTGGSVPSLPNTGLAAPSVSVSAAAPVTAPTSTAPAIVPGFPNTGFLPDIN